MIYAIPVFFILIGVELLVARLHHLELYRFSDAVSNISCGISQQVVGIFTKALTMLSYAYIYYNWRLLDIPNTWWTYILLFLGIDCLYYWFHRYSHEISLFWGTHVVHHQSEDYNLSVALRQSAFQSIISGAFYLPLAFLGFAPIPFMIINTLQTLYQFWIHTEAIDKMPKWFEYIFNTPSHHRVHHGRNPQYIDKNHGGTLIIFDRMFGTFQAEEEPVVYGVTKPLATWNPIWANIDFYKDLAKEFSNTKGFFNKFRLLIEKPGWRTAENGGPQFPPPITRAQQAKYHTIIPNGLSFYVFFHYVFILLGTTLFLATAPKAENLFALPILGNTLLILWSVASLGLVMDKKQLGFVLELGRLVAIPVILYALVLNGMGGNGFYIGLVILILHGISLLYFLRFRLLLRW